MCVAAASIDRFIERAPEGLVPLLRTGYIGLSPDLPPFRPHVHPHGAVSRRIGFARSVVDDAQRRLGLPVRRGIQRSPRDLFTGRTEERKVSRDSGNPGVSRAPHESGASAGLPSARGRCDVQRRGRGDRCISISAPINRPSHPQFFRPFALPVPSPWNGIEPESVPRLLRPKSRGSQVPSPWSTRILSVFSAWKSGDFSGFRVVTGRSCDCHS